MIDYWLVGTLTIFGGTTGGILAICIMDLL